MLKNCNLSEHYLDHTEIVLKIRDLIQCGYERDLAFYLIKNEHNF